MKKLRNWLTAIFVCRTEHTPERHATETDTIIYTNWCSKCHYPLGLGYWKTVRNCPPPNTSAEVWDQYCDKREAQLRRPN